MSVPFDTRRLLAESAPVAVVLAFWSTLALLTHSIVSTGLRYAGVAMALLYVVVRATALSRTIPPTDPPETLEEILAENLSVAIPAGVWFVPAMVLGEFLAPLFEYPALLSSFEFLESLLHVAAFSFTGAGVAAVLLYAISVGLTRTRRSVRSDLGNPGPTPSDGD